MKLEKLSKKTLDELTLPVSLSNWTIGQVAKALIILKEDLAECFRNGETKLELDDDEEITFPLRLICQALGVDYSCDITRKVLENALAKCMKKISALAKLNMKIAEKKDQLQKVINLVEREEKKAAKK